MATNDKRETSNGKKIVVRKNGPYIVHGDVPLARKAQIVSEHGEPLTWKTGAAIETSATYALCPCGQSSNKPFCDGTHHEIGFNGTEAADTGVTTERQVVHAGGTKIVVKRDYSLCAESGFCGNRLTNIQKMVPGTDDTQVRA